MIAKAFLAACRAELEAPKPGNVHVFADGHRMTVADFERSAEAAAGPLCEQGACVGRRILGAVAATAEAVGTNTNLGIVLLCAPLAKAAEQEGPLRESLRMVLDGLSREDAALAFEAITLASPAGLGEAPEHDVRTKPQGSLLDAMTAAAGRDRIAWNYANGFADIFDLGLPAYTAAQQEQPPWWPATAVYLAFLRAESDSHIARKHGLAAAEGVKRETCARLGAFPSLDSLLAFDADLKACGLNPGTSADLTVATLFAARLSNVLREGAARD